MNRTGYRRAALTLAAALALASLAPGQGGEGGKGPKLTKEERAFAEQVNKAIDRGVAYLKTLQAGNGAWPRAGQNQQVGATALAALALLEGGVDPTDKCIQNAATFVREHVINETYNYSVTLAVMFLDRLGDPQDTPVIQHLGVRILAGQNRNMVAGQRGGWGYNLPTPGFAEQQRLKTIVQNRKPMGKFVDPKDRKALTPKDLPKEIVDLIQQGGGGNMPGGGPPVADNSNTQFALLALWCARRHGIPTEGAYALAEQRLRTTQFATGSWSYQAPGGSPNIQMTCCGLIGLALAEGTSKGDAGREAAILKGLQAVAGSVGSPYTDPTTIPKFAKRREANGHEVQSYYALWTLERMCVLYDLKLLRGKDWYKWGAQLLLANQEAGGNWEGGYHEGGCDTSFCLLFLKRTNLTYDLTRHHQKSKTKLKLKTAIEAPN
jgi:hypothetical protein